MSATIAPADAQAVVLTVVPIFLVAFAAATGLYGKRQHKRFEQVRKAENKGRRNRGRALYAVVGYFGLILTAVLATVAEAALLVYEASGVVSRTWSELAAVSTALLALSLVLAAFDEISDQSVTTVPERETTVAEAAGE